MLEISDCQYEFSSILYIRIFVDAHNGRTILKNTVLREPVLLHPTLNIVAPGKARGAGIEGGVKPD